MRRFSGAGRSLRAKKISFFFRYAFSLSLLLRKIQLPPGGSLSQNISYLYPLFAFFHRLTSFEPRHYGGVFVLQKSPHPPLRGPPSPTGEGSIKKTFRCLITVSSQAPLGCVLRKKVL